MRNVEQFKERATGWDIDKGYLTEFAFAIFLTSIIAGFVITSTTYTYRDYLVPLTVGVPSLVLMIFITLSFVSTYAERVVDWFNENPLAQGFGDDEDEDEFADWGITRAVAWSVFALVSFLAFGYFSTPVVIYAFIVIEGETRHTTALKITIPAALVLIGVFEFFLQGNLFEGYVTLWVFEALGLA